MRDGVVLKPSCETQVCELMMEASFYGYESNQFRMHSFIHSFQPIHTFARGPFTFACPAYLPACLAPHDE